MNRKKNQRYLPLIILVIFTVLIGQVCFGFFQNMYSDQLKKFFIDKFGEEAFLGYGPIVGLGMIVLLVLGPIWLYFSENKVTQNLPDRLDEDTRQQLLYGLKRRYESRLQQKMNKELRFEIKLKLKYTKDHTSPETTEHFVIQHEKDAGDFDKLFETYLQKIRRLLILGEPGAGKTVLLLRFALQLIKKAEKDPEFPIPVILNLASWQDKEQDFLHWMEQNLPYSGGEYGIAKEFSKTLVQQNSILPLLDGFDEIAEDYRDSCLEKLYPYLQRLRSSRKATWPEAVLCSRIIEYDAAADAPVFAIVKIQSLRFREVESTLKILIKENDLPAKRLMESLESSALLRKATCSAFYVHTLLNLFSNKETPRFLAQTLADIRAEIIAAYVQTQTAQVQPYPNEKTNLWLGWLAWQMKYRKRAVTFELADMQPDWARRKYISRLYFGVVFGVVFGLIFDLVGGFIGFLIFSLTFYKISTTDVVVFDYKQLKSKYLIVQIVGSLIAGLLIGLIASLVLGLHSGLIFGLILGILVGPSNATFARNKFPKLHYPYQRLNAQLKWKITKWTLILSIALGIGMYSADHSLKGFWLGGILGLIVSIIASPILRHWVLVLALYQERIIPFKYPRFLNAITDSSGLMEKDGGHWRFRHQLLQDYFATWFEETHVDFLPKNWQEVKAGKG